MGTSLVRIDNELEKELKRIQDEMKKQIGSLDLSKPQASRIAANILRTKEKDIHIEIRKAKKGKRGNSLEFL